MRQCHVGTVKRTSCMRAMDGTITCLLTRQAHHCKLNHNNLNFQTESVDCLPHTSPLPPFPSQSSVQQMPEVWISAFFMLMHLRVVVTNNKAVCNNAMSTIYIPIRCLQGLLSYVRQTNLHLKRHKNWHNFMHYLLR